MYNFEPLFDPAVPLAKKIEVINQVRNDPLFLCRYDRLKAMEGKTLAELPPNDAELVRVYIRNQDPEYATTLYNHYLVSLDDSGVVQVQMRNPEELVDELVNKFKTWDIFRQCEDALVKVIAELL